MKKNESIDIDNEIIVLEDYEDNMTKFSIVMPVYNNERYFPLAVQSIEKQGYDNYELIIIDDGSTDKTAEIADTMSKNNSHIKVVHQQNQWIYNSFNNGIALATGDYIYILNSDDCLMPGTFKLFEKKIQEYHPDIIWTKVLHHICDDKQNIIIYDSYNSNRYVTEEKFYNNKEEVRKAWPYFVSTRLAQDQANLYRRDIMQSHLFRNDVYAADTLYNIGIADSIHSALILKEPIYFHYIYNKSSVMNASIGKYYSYAHKMFNEIFIQYEALFEKWKLPEESYCQILYGRRLAYLTLELRNLQDLNCSLSIDEKLYAVFWDSIDDVVKECVNKGNRREELESRILSGARELLLKEHISKENKMYFVYELLESLLRYEKEEEDFKRLEKAVNHPLNPMHIGSIFYDKLIQGIK